MIGVGLLLCACAFDLVPQEREYLPIAGLQRDRDGAAQSGDWFRGPVPETGSAGFWARSELGPSTEDVIAIAEHRFAAATGAGLLQIAAAPAPHCLLVLGPAPLRAELRAFLGAVEARQARRIAIEIAAFACDDEPERVSTRWPGPPPTALRRLCNGTGAVTVDSIRVLDCVRRVPLLECWDAERALRPGEFAHDPCVAAVESGLRVLVLASSLGDAADGILLSAGFAFAAGDAPPRPAPSGLAGTPEHDVAERAVFSGVMRAAIRSGETLVAWSLGDPREGPRFAIGVRARWLDPAPPVPGMAVLPIAALSARRLASRDDEDGPFTSPLGQELADDLARSAGVDEATIVAPFGQQLVVIGDEHARESVARELARRIAVRTESIELECVTRARDGALRHRLVVPVLATAPLGFRRGTESRRAVGLGLDIDMVVLGPSLRIATVFEGLSLDGRFDRGDGRDFAALKLRASRSSADERATRRAGTSALELRSLAIDDAGYEGAIERGLGVPLGAWGTVMIR